MASFSSRLRAAGVLLVFSALITWNSAAHACREGITAGSLDGSAAVDPWQSEWTEGEQAAGGCPIPPCSTHGCATVNPSTPFQRLPGYQSAPISPYADCFSVAKRDANFYVQLSTKGNDSNPGFHRHVSTDGGFTWTAGPVVVAPSTYWWSGIKCPDLLYLPNGDLLLYFRAGIAGGAGIARAVSTDDGVTWTPDAAPVLTSPVAGWTIDNPSVLRRSATSWVMAYTVDCVGPQHTGAFQMAETYLATSSDGINWTHSPLNPALQAGPCGAWDQGGIANPAILADPISSNTLHLFYSGLNWHGTTTRGCIKIGHAISTNNGRTWCKTGVVLDHPPAGSGAWDVSQYFASNYTLEPNNTLRMYYWAPALGGGGLGIAEASWPLAGCGPAPEELTTWNASKSPQAPHDVDVADAHGSFEIAGRFELRSHPNPTSGGVVIEHAVPRAELGGSGSVSIIDIRGRHIAQIWSGSLDEAPTHFEWNGLDGSQSRVAAGRYLIRMERSGEVLATGWITVMP